MEDRFEASTTALPIQILSFIPVPERPALIINSLSHPNPIPTPIVEYLFSASNALSIFIKVFIRTAISKTLCISAFCGVE